jgi:Tfp pilus assembly protein PilP
MKNSIATMRALFCLIAAMLLLVGCDEPDKTAAQPQTVRKKIAAKAETGPPAATAVAAAPAQPAPAAAAGEKPVLAQVAKPGTPPAVPVPPPEPKEPPPAQPAPAAAAGEKPVLAQVAKPGTPPAVPVPPPEPKEPPPTPAAESPPPASLAPAAPLPLSQAPTAIEPFPPTGVKPFTPDGNPQQRGMAADDSQIAALLNIQAPPPYNPKGKVDPFEPLLRDETTATAVAKLRAKDDPNRPKTPLEKIDLGQLKLTAILTTPGGNRALMEETSGKGYIIEKGTYIGPNSGKVVGIEAGKVLVEEEFEDIYGKSITQKKEITLPKPPGEF